MVASLAVTIVMLAGLSLFVDIAWSRFARRSLGAILAGGAAWAAFGAAIGAARARGPGELAAGVHGLPADRVPLAGAVGDGERRLYDGLKVFRALFPFAPALKALSAGLDSAASGYGTAILHLAVLTLAYGLLARVALRRFAAA